MESHSFQRTWPIQRHVHVFFVTAVKELLAGEFSWPQDHVTVHETGSMESGVRCECEYAECE